MIWVKRSCNCGFRSGSYEKQVSRKWLSENAAENNAAYILIALCLANIRISRNRKGSKVARDYFVGFMGLMGLSKDLTQPKHTPLFNNKYSNMHFGVNEARN